MSFLVLQDIVQAFLRRLSFTPDSPSEAKEPVVASAVSQVKAPSLSVVIPAFNEAAFIAETIHSVWALRRQYAGALEIIVVDNNSTDETAQIAAALGARVVFEPHKQIARARNTGAKAARGDYMVFLDADTRLEGNILDKVAAHLSSGRVIGGGAWVEPDSGWFGRLFFNYLINYPLVLKGVSVGPFLYCERAAFVRVGGFDEQFYAAEEFSLAKRLKREGRKGAKHWRIIKHDPAHRVITSSRKFAAFGPLNLFLENAHLLWRPQKKLRQKAQCRFWYDCR